MTYDKYYIAKRDYAMAKEMFPDLAKDLPEWEDLSQERKDDLLKMALEEERRMQEFGEAISKGIISTGLEVETKH